MLSSNVKLSSFKRPYLTSNGSISRNLSSVMPIFLAIISAVYWLVSVVLCVKTIAFIPSSEASNEKNSPKFFSDNSFFDISGVSQTAQKNGKFSTSDKYVVPSSLMICDVICWLPRFLSITSFNSGRLSFPKYALCTVHIVSNKNLNKSILSSLQCVFWRQNLNKSSRISSWV